MSLILATVTRQDHWQAYHFIRRHVLYELRGREGYDEMHPDEHRKGNIPFLLLDWGHPVGTVRLDVEGEGHGTVRLVAVVPDRQRQGLGRAMMTMLDIAAVGMGVTCLRVYPAPDAIAFYQKLGWIKIDAPVDRLLMMKILEGGTPYL